MGSGRECDEQIASVIPTLKNGAVPINQVNLIEVIASERRKNNEQWNSAMVLRRATTPWTTRMAANAGMDALRRGR
jgi:hypothetical protein